MKTYSITAIFVMLFSFVGFAVVYERESDIVAYWIHYIMFNVWLIVFILLNKE